MTLREKPQTFAQRITQAHQIPGRSAQTTSFLWQVREPQLHKAYAIVSMLRQGAANFGLLHDRAPKSWDELANSGLCGIDKRSTNPWSLKPLDGQAGPRAIRIQMIEGALAVDIFGDDGKKLAGGVSS